MAEYIDRDAFLEYMKKTNRYFDVKHDIENFPVADVAPVVRCGDCKYSTLPSMQTQIYGKPGTLTCHNRKSPCNRRNVTSDDYCSYADRKDDNAT